MTPAEFQSFTFEKGLRRGLEFSSPFTDSIFLKRSPSASKKIKTAGDLFTASERKGIEKEKIVPLFIFSPSALTITRTVELSKKNGCGLLWFAVTCDQARGKGRVLFFSLWPLLPPFHKKKTPDRRLALQPFFVSSRSAPRSVAWRHKERLWTG